MKNNIKRTIQTLETLGFRNRAGDYDRGRKMRLYVHDSYPDDEIRLYEGSGDVAARAAELRAHQIVGMGSASPKAALSIKDRLKAQRERERREAQRKLDAEIRRVTKQRSRMTKQQIEAAAMKALSTKERQALKEEEVNHHFYAGLMRHGFGR